MSMSGVEPAYTAFFTSSLCAFITSFTSSALTLFASLSSSSGPILSILLSSLCAFTVTSHCSIFSVTSPTTLFLCSSLSAFFWFTLVLFLCTFSFGCAVCLHCLLPASVFLSLRSGMLSSHSSFSSFLSFHISCAVRAHLPAASIILLCICGLNSLPIIDSIPLGTPPAAVHSLSHPSYLLAIHDTLLQSHPFSAHSLSSCASRCSHFACAHLHPHIAWSVVSDSSVHPFLLHPPSLPSSSLYTHLYMLSLLLSAILLSLWLVGRVSVSILLHSLHEIPFAESRLFIMDAHSVSCAFPLASFILLMPIDFDSLMYLLVRFSIIHSLYPPCATPPLFPSTYASSPFSSSAIPHTVSMSFDCLASLSASSFPSCIQ